MNILRRLSLSRLLLLCALVIGAGVSVTALAFALGTGPVPPPKPLAQALHDALSGTPVEGVSASVQLSDHLLEGASLSTGGQLGELASSPLISGGSGRLWIAKDGRVRLELQSQKGYTQILYDGNTVSLYDAADNTLYRYTLPAHEQAPAEPAHQHEAPSVSTIEEAISHLSKRAEVSGASATDVAGRPAYEVRISPKEGGSLLGGAEVSFDADHGVPLSAAIYSSTSPSPVIELTASEVSYGPVADSVFAISPPANAKIEEIAGSDSAAHKTSSSSDWPDKPKITTQGQGPSTIAVLQSKAKAGAKGGAAETLEGLPKVTINGAVASELRTELGTLLSFERSGVRYLLAGSVTPAAIEALARGL